MSTETLTAGTPAAPAATPIAVLGLAVHVPGRAAAGLPGSPAEPACEPQDAKTVLGRKGLLGKEPATLLALCAVHRAFGLPPGRPAEPLPGAARTAVIVASNLGNVRTVCEVVSVARERSVAAVSPLDVPNASSNVIASTIAIWYGFTGPNLTVCNGSTSGLDAVRLGQLLLRSGRAERVVVVGVEPVDPIATRLTGDRLTAGAGCVILGPPQTGDHAATAVRVGPVRRGGPEADDGLDGLYGAAGVVRLASAAARIAAAGSAAGPVTVGCGDASDGHVSVEVGVG